MERLDKIIANRGIASRREVKELVRQGRVLVDGVPASAPDVKVSAETVAITVDGVPVSSERYTYLLLHKPAGVLTATEDKHQPTVMELLPESLRRRGLAPVGRLDKDTEGLLLLTDDGELTHRLLSPRYHVDKVYYAKVEGVPDAADAEAAMPARQAGAAGRRRLPCDTAGGEVPSGEADAGQPGQAGALPEAAVHGAAAAGGYAVARTVP